MVAIVVKILKRREYLIEIESDRVESVTRGMIHEEVGLQSETFIPIKIQTSVERSTKANRQTDTRLAVRAEAGERSVLDRRKSGDADEAMHNVQDD